MLSETIMSVYMRFVVSINPNSKDQSELYNGFGELLFMILSKIIVSTQGTTSLPYSYLIQMAMNVYFLSPDTKPKWNGEGGETDNTER